MNQPPLESSLAPLEDVSNNYLALRLIEIEEHTSNQSEVLFQIPDAQKATCYR